ncbi:HTH-type transcriptional regulator GltC [Ruegeria denitrificans]|uniref:HTH-type transcriptional regulator GltC n=1 Tax=Ruegeria denitrificans TaxID=1715692 RepID=A0A0N7M9C9_9RHOB|nr:LysR family transcriptional regulator [Ruegeria denitrificans]CUJ97910.1 HTH-type transcriptional regulator GltC [Ruegeria denitrificans]
MNIKALRAFRATLSEGSLVAASEILHRSQPAVSRLITGLEAELKLTLFDRSGRNLTPTPEGLAFYKEAGRILDNLDEVPRIAAEIKAGRTETLRIVTMPRIAQSLSAPAVARFMTENPDTNVSLDVRARREAGKWLAGREYDIGIGALPVDHPGIVTKPLLRVRAQAVLPANHPLSSRDHLTADELATEPVIRLMHGLLLRDQLDDIFRSAGVTPTQTCEVAASQLACALVAEGAGVTIADELVAAQTTTGNLALVPMIPERWMTFGLLYPISETKSKALPLFEEALFSAVSELALQSKTLENIA